MLGLQWDRPQPQDVPWVPGVSMQARPQGPCAQWSAKRFDARPFTEVWTECAAPLHDEHHLHGGRTECAAPPGGAPPARRHGRSAQHHTHEHLFTAAWTECAAPPGGAPPARRQGRRAQRHTHEHLFTAARTECAAPPGGASLHSGMDDSCTRRSIPARRHGRSVQRHYQVHPEVEWWLLCSSGGVVPEWWVL